MIVLLGSKDDSVMLGLYPILANRHTDVLMVHAEELVFAPGWLHKLDRNGHAITEINLPCRKKLNSKNVRGIFNRIPYLPVFHFNDPIDRAYAQAEFQALFWSFLKGLEPFAINPLQADMPCSDPGSNWFYKVAACRYGIPVVAEQYTSSLRWRSDKGLSKMAPVDSEALSYKQPLGSVIANLPVFLHEKQEQSFYAYWANGKMFSPLPIPFEDKWPAFMSDMKLDFVEISVAKCDGALKIHHINPFPAYAPPEVLQALADALYNKSTQS